MPRTGISRSDLLITLWEFKQDIAFDYPCFESEARVCHVTLASAMARGQHRHPTSAGRISEARSPFNVAASRQERDRPPLLFALGPSPLLVRAIYISNHIMGMKKEEAEQIAKRSVIFPTRKMFTGGSTSSPPEASHWTQ